MYYRAIARIQFKIIGYVGNAADFYNMIDRTYTPE